MIDWQFRNFFIPDERWLVMRKFLTISVGSLALILALSSCDVERKEADTEVSEQSWSDANPNTPPTNPPGWDEEYKKEAPDRGSPSSGQGSLPAELSTSEAARLAEWDGTGDRPYGDASNDGRFSDVTCAPSGQPANGYTGGVACTYADGTTAAGGVTYQSGVWMWSTTTLSTPGQCPSEDSCSVVWDHATTSPVVVSGGHLPKRPTEGS